MSTQSTQDPSGVGRPVEQGRLEKSAGNSGIVVGESKDLTASTAEDPYKTEFVKVYQDAGVVGVAMLTLLVLCLLLGLFCSRLIKMYIALTGSRDVLEATRTTAVEKLATSMLVMRSEVTTALGEIRKEHESHAARMEQLAASITESRTRADPALAQLREVHEAMERLERVSAQDRQDKLERLEQLLSQTTPKGGKR